MSIHTTTNIFIFIFQVFPTFYPLAKWNWIWSLERFLDTEPIHGLTHSLSIYTAFPSYTFSLSLPSSPILSLIFLFLSVTHSYFQFRSSFIILSYLISSGFFFLVIHSGDHLLLSTSVCLSVCNKSSHTSHHKFSFWIFEKKNVLAQKWAFQGQKGAKMWFLAICLFKMHQILAILHIMINNEYI